MTLKRAFPTGHRPFVIQVPKLFFVIVQHHLPNHETPNSPLNESLSTCCIYHSPSCTPHPGYGVVTPTTPLGQILVILYALPGIPLALITLNSIGGLISNGFNRLVRAFEKRALNRAEPRHLEMKVSGLTCLLTTTTLLAGSAVMTRWTGWTFVEALYFLVVSFTTIGFGDYIPAQAVGDSFKKAPSAEQWLLNMVGFVTVLFGLAVMAAMVNALVVLAGKGHWPPMPCACSSRVDSSRGREHDDESATREGRVMVKSTFHMENVGQGNEVAFD